jgi:hypothetical protein
VKEVSVVIVDPAVVYWFAEAGGAVLQGGADQSGVSLAQVTGWEVFKCMTALERSFMVCPLGWLRSEA